MIRIISTKEYNRLKENERKLAVILVHQMEARKTGDNGTTLNCGYKSCQFSTTDERGLKIHRSRVHKKR